MIAALICLSLLKAPSSTPESTIQSVVASYNRADWKAVYSQFKGGPYSDAIEYLRLTWGDDSSPKVEIDHADLVTTGEQSGGLVLLRSKSLAQTSKAPPPDSVSLVKIKGAWKISDARGANGLFSQLLSLTKTPKSKLYANAEIIQRGKAAHKLQLIAQAALMYVADGQHAKHLSQSNFKQVLAPYFTDPSTFVGSDGKILDVQINSEVAGSVPGTLSHSSRLVLFSIGPKSSLRYYGEKTPVALVNGQVKILKRVDVAKLLWK